MTLTSSPDSGAQRVAIASDGSALPSGDNLTSTLRDEAELISGLAQVPARPTPIPASGAPTLAAGIRALPADIGAVLLTRVESERARHVQEELQDGGARPLVTDADVTAIALAAAALGSLAYAGRRTQDSRVVLAGARNLPLLTTLLMAAGVSDITIWHQSDAVIFPLHNIVFGAHIVIDLVGELPSSTTGRRTVITRTDAGAAPYAAAGLLQAATYAPGLTFDIEVYSACTYALMAAADRSVPHVKGGKGVALTQLIADAATSVFHTQHSR
jgi:malate dehydrogenase (oxaloacetate-decarboxylating)